MGDQMDTSQSIITGLSNVEQGAHKEVEIGSNELEIVFDFSVGTRKVLDTFEEVGKQMGFELIEEEMNQATLIKKNKKGFMEMLNCFSNDLTDSDVTAIKLTLKTNEGNSTRVCRVRGLVGSRVQVRLFINQFNQKARGLRNYKSLYEEDYTQNSQEATNPMHVEVCANYSFYKILSLENYGLGSRLAQRIRDFQRFSDVQKTLPLLPQPIQQIHDIINQTVDGLFKEFNSGRKEMEKIMPYCRVSVQKYVCEKVIPIISPVYQESSRAKEEEFVLKRAKILDSRTLEEIFDDVCLNRRFWLVKNVPEGFNKPLTVDKLLSNRKTIPFFRAAEELQRIPQILSLREKIKHCELMYTTIKSAVFSYTGGREELNNMEDILPVLMVVILVSSIPCLYSEIEMMNDFMSLESWEGESQKRLLINLRESFNYIARDWKI